MSNATFTAHIIRSDDGGRLAIAYCDSAGTSSTHTGWEFAADAEGLADAKAAIKNDGLTSPDDFDGIDALTMPEAGGESAEVALTGPGDA
jgi:hypothetical protein